MSESLADKRSRAKKIYMYLYIYTQQNWTCTGTSHTQPRIIAQHKGRCGAKVSTLIHTICLAFGGFAYSNIHNRKKNQRWTFAAILQVRRATKNGAGGSRITTEKNYYFVTWCPGRGIPITKCIEFARPFYFVYIASLPALRVCVKIINNNINTSATEWNRDHPPYSVMFRTVCARRRYGWRCHVECVWQLERMRSRLCHYYGCMGGRVC